MDPIEMNDLEIASDEVVRQAARDFAAALVRTAEFHAFETASGIMEEDAAAQAALQAFQAKQQAIKMLQTLQAVTPAEREEFEQLRQAFLDQPCVAAYFQAQADLLAVCQAAGDILSNATGLNYGASASASGCC
jgi:cell fate (sporulation/competence/biofilm development) regulator YlbF (YheA/YmcA/DUF963 family)